MALPDPDELGSMDYVYNGLPYTSGTNGNIDLNTMDYAYNGLPFTGPVNNGVNEIVVTLDDLVFAGDTGETRYRDLIATIDDLVFSGDEEIVDDGIARGDDTAPVMDEFSVTLFYGDTAVIDDLVFVGEEIDSAAEVTSYYSVFANVVAENTSNHSTTVSISAQSTIYNSVFANIKNYNLAPSTDINNPSNAFEPTIVVDGEYVSSHSSTNGGVTNLDETCLYIALKNAGMSDCSMCDLESFSMNFTETGGNWNITSLCSALGDCNDAVTLYGFEGTIKSPGLVISSNQAGFTYSGIFGNPNLFTPFRYVVVGSPLGTLLSDQNLTSPAIQNITTASAAVGYIASKVGTTVQWLVKDVPVSDFRLEEGGTAIEALQSLASRAGGRLRWNGLNAWKIVYPDVSEGIFEIPSCHLILPGGVTKNCYCDVIDNRAIIAGSVPSQNTSPGTTTDPVDPDTNPSVQLLATLNSRLTADDPPAIFDLPPDYDKVYCQILVNPGQSTSGNNLISIHNFMTTNPREYFLYDASGFGIDYIFKANIGGAVIPQVRVDNKCFPTKEANNAAINNNHFIFKLYYTRKQITAPPGNATKANETLGQTQDVYRYSKVCDFSLQCLFFGAIPVPGMLIRATIPNVKVYVPNCDTGAMETIVIGDINVEGICESVSFSFPGILNINFSTHKKILFYNSRQIDYGNQITP